MSEEAVQAPVGTGEVDVRQEAIKDFVKEYGELVAKHGVDFACYPVYIPDGSGGFKVTVQNTPVDIKNQPTKSPFVATE